MEADGEVEADGGEMGAGGGEEVAENVDFVKILGVIAEGVKTKLSENKSFTLCDIES